MQAIPLAEPLSQCEVIPLTAHTVWGLQPYCSELWLGVSQTQVTLWVLTKAPWGSMVADVAGGEGEEAESSPEQLRTLEGSRMFS